MTTTKDYFTQNSRWLLAISIVSIAIIIITSIFVEGANTLDPQKVLGVKESSVELEIAFEDANGDFTFASDTDKKEVNKFVQEAKVAEIKVSKSIDNHLYCISVSFS